MTSDSSPATAGVSPLIRDKAPLILAEIKKARSVLLHCHPSPDPDSVGSALAMKFALEQLGKKATVIAGDSTIPEAFMHFPGTYDIVHKNFSEIDLKDFDLFIVLDSSQNGISRITPAIIPSSLVVVNIDHHKSNIGFGLVSLVVPEIGSCCEILFSLFQEMGVRMTSEIAQNLFIGIYTDTGGFKYEATTSRTFSIAGELVKYAPNFPQLISKMENSATLEDLVFQGLALSNVESLLGGHFALSVVSNDQLKKNKISGKNVSAGMISSILRRVASFDIVGACIETDPGVVKFSFRSKDGDAYDVSKLAVALGGGGHKAAAGVELKMPLAEARALVVSKAKELYNL